MATILITHGVPAERFALLKPNTLLIPKPGKAFGHGKLLDLVPECDAIVACGPMDQQILKECRRCRLIAVYGAGYDAVDVAAATRYGIPVCNIPDTVTETTAQLAMAQLLTLLRRVSEMDRKLRSKETDHSLFTMGGSMGVSPEGMTLGIVGMGRIGARVAEFGRFLQMRVVYTNPSIKPYSVTGNARRLPLAELLRVADVVSLHCPLRAGNYHLIGAEELRLMKPTAFLLNSARGKLIDEAALADALEKGQISGAALDVFENEPDITERLKRMDNVVLTPHIGSNTLRTRNRMAEQCAEEIRNALAGRKPDNLINPQVWVNPDTDI